jgi:hypothetical protein
MVFVDNASNVDDNPRNYEALEAKFLGGKAAIYQLPVVSVYIKGFNPLQAAVLVPY